MCYIKKNVLLVVPIRQIRILNVKSVQYKIKTFQFDICNIMLVHAIAIGFLFQNTLYFGLRK